MTTVTITSAVELSAAQLEKIKKAVFKKYGKDTLIETVVHTNLLGGVQIAVGSKLLDASVKNRLDQLKKKLAS